jgi:hypothetical protein
VIVVIFVNDSDRTHKEAITHLPEINGTSRVEIDLWIDFCCTTLSINRISIASDITDRSLGAMDA